MGEGERDGREVWRGIERVERGRARGREIGGESGKR